MVASYIVAIPSYKRAKILKDKTLTMLTEGGVPPSKIHVFVATEEEANAYKDVIGSNYKIIVGKLGITNQRKFIRSYFPVNTKIVSVDDDVGSLQKWNIVTGKLEKLNKVHKFFIDAFKTASENKLGLWGVFPTANPFYMKDQAPISTSLKFVIGTLNGFVNTHNDINLGDLEEKEDVEMTIQYYMRDGGVLRYNHVTFITKFKNPNGGLGGINNRFEANQRAAEYLLKKYPFCTRLKVRKNGMHEIVLRMKNVA